MQKEAALVDDFLFSYLQARAKHTPDRARQLVESMHYSLFTGGKRFRPALVLMTAKALGVDLNKCLPFAAAVEMIHTYSLIHDDLPSLDNDDVRRGRPTNHKVYGEAMALLAGDSLLTEASKLLAHSYRHQPEIGLELVDLLSEAAGMNGMIGGQVLDLAAQGAILPFKPVDLPMDEFETLLRLKTGALIQVSVEGAAVIARCSSEKRQTLKQFGATLGFCFQLADDLHDYDPKDPEASGYPKKVGPEKTKDLLKQQSEHALNLLKKMGPDHQPQLQDLRDLVQFNASRTY